MSKPPFLVTDRFTLIFMHVISQAYQNAPNPFVSKKYNDRGQLNIG